jgi:hypothetical protein
MLSVGIKKIKKNWPEYRCNPTIMPFASLFGQDTMTNFAFCVENLIGCTFTDYLALIACIHIKEVFKIIRLN